MFSQYKSSLGSNFISVSRFKFSKWSFLRIDTRNITYLYCVSVSKYLNSYRVAKFMKGCITLRDTVRLDNPFYCLDNGCVI